MTTTTFFFIFIPILALILLLVNLIFAPHNPYQEKDSAFECGFHSFLGQNRTQFSISFFIFALLFLLFDLEILLVYPYVVSAYTNGIYGLVIMLIFFLALTLGFAFELGKNALKIDSRQVLSLVEYKGNIRTESISALILPLQTAIKKGLVNITVSRVITAAFVIFIITLLRSLAPEYFVLNLDNLANNFVLGMIGWTTNTIFLTIIREFVASIGIDFSILDVLYATHKSLMGPEKFTISQMDRPGSSSNPSGDPINDPTDKSVGDILPSTEGVDPAENPGWNPPNDDADMASPSDGGYESEEFEDFHRTPQPTSADTEEQRKDLMDYISNRSSDCKGVSREVAVYEHAYKILSKSPKDWTNQDLNALSEAKFDPYLSIDENRAIILKNSSQSRLYLNSWRQDLKVTKRLANSVGINTDEYKEGNTNIESNHWDNDRVVKRGLLIRKKFVPNETTATQDALSSEENSTQKDQETTSDDETTSWEREDSEDLYNASPPVSNNPHSVEESTDETAYTNAGRDPHGEENEENAPEVPFYRRSSIYSLLNPVEEPENSLSSNDTESREVSNREHTDLKRKRDSMEPVSEEVPNTNKRKRDSMEPDSEEVSNTNKRKREYSESNVEETPKNKRKLYDSESDTEVSNKRKRFK